MNNHFDGLGKRVPAATMCTIENRPVEQHEPASRPLQADGVAIKEKNRKNPEAAQPVFL